MTLHLIQRKPIRLETYDYSSAGAYFVTICTQLCGYEWFGRVTSTGMQLNQAGQMVQGTWQNLTNQFDIGLDTFIIMPDHIHGIIVLGGNGMDVAQNGHDKSITHNPVGAGLVPARLTNHNVDMDVSESNDVKNDINAPVSPDFASHRATTRVAPTDDVTMNPILGDVVGAFKSITTNQYIRGVREHNWMPFEKRFWQRGFYDRIVRNNAELERCRDYIEGNPARWLEKANPRETAAAD